MPSNPWYQAIEEAAQARMPAILHDWIPGGRVNGRDYVAASVRGGPGQSFRVRITDCLFKDFATGEKGGKGAIPLYAVIRHLDYKDAARELGELLGVPRPDNIKLVRQVWEPVVPIPEWAPMTNEGLPEVPVRQDGTEVRGAWCYLDRDGGQTCWRIRLEKLNGDKDILPLTFCRNRDSGAAEWRWRDLPPPRGLYRLELLAAIPDAPVLIVEGEKTAEAAARLLADWVVVTWPGGTNRVGAKHTDWSPLVARTGRKVIWPDNDKPGLAAAALLAGEIIKGASVVQPDPAWKQGWDLADGEAEGWDKTQVLAWIEAHSVAVEEKPDKLPRVECNVASGDLFEQTVEAWAAIKQVNTPVQLLDSADRIVLVDRDVFGRARRQPMDVTRLRSWLVDRVVFSRFVIDEETNRPTSIPTKPPIALLENLLAAAKPRLPFLTHMCEVPVFLADGRLLMTEGFDESSGVYYLPAADLADLSIPESVSSEEKDGSLALIDDLFHDFPWVDQTDRAHCLAFLMLPLMRNLITGPTPMFRFEAPQAGTGKSLLMKMLAAISSSRTCILSQLDNEDEWRKRITSALADDPDTFLIDNATTLESDQLKKLLTDEIWEDRKMREHEDVRYQVRAAFGVSLNNPVFSREIMRRSLRVRIDAQSEHPELRPASGWRHQHIQEYARINRRALVEALLILIRYGLAHPIEDDTALVLGGYEDFCRRMGGILRAIGVGGFMGDRDDQSALSTDEEAFANFIAAWGARAAEQTWWTIRDLLPIAQDTEDLELGKQDNQRAQETALGTLLHRHRGMTCGDWTIDIPRKGRHRRYRLLSRNRSAMSAEPTEVTDEAPF